jgi:hypothetical protein
MKRRRKSFARKHLSANRSGHTMLRSSQPEAFRTLSVQSERLPSERLRLIH